MTEIPDTSPSSTRDRRWFIRRVLYPVLVIAAIIAVIWWLEGRDSGGVSPTGVRYGPVELPAALQTPGLEIGTEEGRLAPDFLLETLGGGEARLSDFRGQPVVINFWARWCRPCRIEMPHLVQAYDRYRDDGLVIIGLNMQEGRAVIQPFVDDFGMEFPVLMDRTGRVGDVYRLLGLPTTIFIDRDGVIRSVFRGPFEGEAMGTAVQGAIGSAELQERIEEIMAEDEG
jgi:peroxiredoxin